MTPADLLRSVQQVNASLSRHQEALHRDADLLVQGFSMALFNEIVSGGRYSPGTPIDTGFARASWYGGIGGEGQPPSVAKPVTKRRGERASEARAAALQIEATAHKAKAGDTLILANAAPYVRRLEFGWSRQAPQGFIRRAVMAAQHILNEVAAHVLKLRPA